MEHTKNTIRHHVNELFSNLFGPSSSDAEVLAFAEQLERNANPRLITKFNVDKAKRILSENNQDNDDFISKYDELRLRNIRELDPLVYLLALIKTDRELFDLVHDPALQKSKEFNSDLGSNDRLVLEKDDMDKLRQLIDSSNSSRYTSIEQLRGHCAGDSRAPDDFDQTEWLASSEMQTTSLAKDEIRREEKCASKSRPRNQTPEKRLKHRPVAEPLLPNWTLHRVYLSADFFQPQWFTAKLPPTLPIESLPLNAQEKLVIDDILATFQGNDGAYIKALPLKDQYGLRKFTVDEKMHPSLLDIVNKLLPICSQYSSIVRFVEEKSRYEFGLVNQALCEAIDIMLQDYLKLICDLETKHETNKLSVSILYPLLQEKGYVFEHVSRLVMDINRGQCIGGAVLSIIQEVIHNTASVDRIHEFMINLMQRACVPFFAALQKWMFRGVLRDHYREFFIEARNLPTPASPSPDQQQATPPLPLQAAGAAVTTTTTTTNDYVDWAFYWENNYRLVHTQLPPFLESHAEEILKTGKYLNMVMQCDNSIEFTPPEKIDYSERDRDYLDITERAYTVASRMLLDTILKQKDLKGLLKSVKRYFLLDQADFIVNFMDTASIELRKSKSEVSLASLESLLELALQISSSNCDPHKENLRVIICDCDLISHMFNVLQLCTGKEIRPEFQDLNLTGLEAFSLDYHVDWPISLVINRMVLDRYQMIFRHLFYCRHVERQLTTIWFIHKTAKRASSSSALWFNPAFLLGQRMIAFIQHLQYYMTVEVIEPTWRAFLQRLDKANNLDEVLDAHMRCLEVCMDDCLLTSPELLGLVGKLNAVCINFSNFVRRVAHSGYSPSSGTLSCASAIALSRPLLHHPSMSSVDHMEGTRQRLFSTSSEASFASKTKTFSISGSSTDVRKTMAAFDMDCVGSLEAYSETLSTFDTNFTRLLMELMSKIRSPSAHQRSQLLSLVTRLDFNGFYSKFSHPGIRSHPDAPAGDSEIQRPFGSMGGASSRSIALLQSLERLPHLHQSSQALPRPGGDSSSSSLQTRLRMARPDKNSIRRSNSSHFMNQTNETVSLTHQHLQR